MSALVQVKNDRVVASSLDVAKSFGKQHQHVMRTVRELLTRRPDLQSNFGRMIQTVQTGKGAARQSQYYEMDRKGFMLLTMGFTGDKALSLKILWIDDYDRMEAILSSPINDDDGEDESLLAAPARKGDDLPFIERLKYEPPNIQIAFVREMRMARGRPGAIRAMETLGWSESTDMTDRHLMLAAGDPVTGQVIEWLRERTEDVPGHRVGSTVLHRDFVQWCFATGRTQLSMTMFCRKLQMLGYVGISSNRRYRIGLKLKD